MTSLVKFLLHLCYFIQFLIVSLTLCIVLLCWALVLVLRKMSWIGLLTLNPLHLVIWIWYCMFAVAILFPVSYSSGSLPFPNNIDLATGFSLSQGKNTGNDCLLQWYFWKSPWWYLQCWENSIWAFQEKIENCRVGFTVKNSTSKNPGENDIAVCE